MATYSSIPAWRIPCLKAPRGAWWATVHGVPNSWTWLKWLTTHTYPQKDCNNFYMNCTKSADKFRDITDIFTTLSKVFLFILLVLLLFYQHFVLCCISEDCAQLCLTLCDPMDCSPPDSSVYGILQARILEWVAISYSRGSSWPRDWTGVSCIGRPILHHGATWEAQLCSI